MNTIRSVLVSVGMGIGLSVACSTSAEAAIYYAKCYNSNGNEFCNLTTSSGTVLGPVDHTQGGADCRNFYVRYVGSVSGWSAPASISIGARSVWPDSNVFVGWGASVAVGGLSGVNIGYQPNRYWVPKVHMSQANTAANVRFEYNGVINAAGNESCRCSSYEYICS